ncbi:hypothetical protein IMSHALPRED_010099 [Imshaugia aleurites]|uniref:Uncharacterized protein n=1 Tax=Imshaugia aleurites TaxID=172621 RepID=A0A8H3IYW5_9LECA|nr:hypothetical protein IMSHALPRED_010099 [Imshaugia aleurites]
MPKTPLSSSGTFIPKDNPRPSTKAPTRQNTSREFSPYDPHDAKASTDLQQTIKNLQAKIATREQEVADMKRELAFYKDLQESTKEEIAEEEAGAAKVTSPTYEYKTKGVNFDIFPRPENPGGGGGKV